MKKQILVTGAAGYIGRNVINVLSQLDVSVLAIDRHVGASADNVTWIQADILSDEFSFAAVADTVPDVCLHLAWRNGFVHDADSHMEDVSRHYRFLIKAIEFGIHQIVAMGTMHEIGYWEGAISEDTPCSPQSLYGIAKDALRRAFLLKAASTTIRAQWLRGFYIVGSDEASQSVFGKILRAAESGEMTFPFTSGKNKFDFLSIEEFCRQIVACILQDKIIGIINCCSGDPKTLGDMAEMFIRDNGLNIKLNYGAYPDRPYDSPGVWGDATKIRNIMAGAPSELLGRAAV